MMPEKKEPHETMVITSKGNPELAKLIQKMSDELMKKNEKLYRWLEDK